MIQIGLVLLERNLRTRNLVLPTNLPIPFGDSTKSYDVLCNTIVIIITTFTLPIICRIFYA